MKNLYLIRIPVITCISYILFGVLGTVWSEKAFGQDYPIVPVPFTNIEVQDDFWMPKIHRNYTVSIPHGFKMSENRIRNFEIAAGLKTGSFASSFPFDDTDLYKIIEACSYSLYYYPDPEFKQYVDSMITLISAAQEEDGYLYTNRTIAELNHTSPHPWAGSERWQKVHDLSHELYNLGHLFEAAVAYHQATGDEKLLEVAERAAQLIDQVFGWGLLEDYPGHQIVETGLARLYRATGKTEYLDLAKFFLDVRGPGGAEYCQAHEKVVDQEEAVGHAVRAVYMYSGMADIAALTSDPSYTHAIEKIWEDIVNKKIYVTGGIGASGGNEGFNDPYFLPNGSAYCETCASIGFMYLNHRLFLMKGDASYMDVFERTLYNSFLSAISVSGDRFFYPNPLLSSGNRQRSEWFECACCPPNVMRFIPSVPGYIYARRSDSLYVNLYMKGSAGFELGGDSLRITQNGNYPWDGELDLVLEPDQPKQFTLMLRIPGWARNQPIPGDLYYYAEPSDTSYTITLNGQPVSYSLDKGYAVLKRTWSAGDSVHLSLPMPVRKVLSSDSIAENVDRMALERGPVLFCAENSGGGSILSLSYDPAMETYTEFDSSLVGGTQVIHTTSRPVGEDPGAEVTLIPYHLWNNRGPLEMQVWLSVREPRELPDSLIIIDEPAGDFATTNYVSPWEDLTGIYDLYDPVSSADKGQKAFGNWTASGSTVGQWNWVQYNLHRNYSISASEVYWWDDNAGITLPDASYLSYYDASSDQFIKIDGTEKSLEEGTLKYDSYNKDVFSAVYTDKIRLYFIGNRMAQGILEWMIYGEGSTGSEEPLADELCCTLYPNPMTEQCTIVSRNPGNTTIQVFSSKGTLLLEDEFRGNYLLSEQQLEGNGLYLVKVGAGKGQKCFKLVH